MNRQYSREDLFRMNQQDAKGMRDKKIAERQARVNQERMELENINRELELTKMREQNTKLQRMNEMKDEYNQFIITKQNSKEESKRIIRSKKEAELTGTFKIGGENREIKKRTYDDVTDGLVLNPSRNVPNSSQRGRIEQEPEIKQSVPIRRKIQGYNIINHSDSNTFSNKENNLIVENKPSFNQLGIQSNPIHDNTSKYNTHSNSNNPYVQKDIEGIENLENYHRHYDINSSKPKGSHHYIAEGGDDKVKRYYEEYLKQKLNEEEKINKYEEYKHDYNNENNYEYEMKNYNSRVAERTGENENLEQLNEIYVYIILI